MLEQILGLNIALRIIICVTVGYLLGSLNAGILLSKAIKHEDIREKGSGNAGFTNVKRVYGTKLSLVVCAADILKTVAASLLCGLLFPEAVVAGRLLGGIAAQAGHIHPIYFGFRGGKGFICGMAAVAATDWRIFLAALAILFAVTLSTKYVSLGSLSASITYSVLFAILYPTPLVIILACVMAATVIITHIPNIKRLINKTENKTYFFKWQKRETK